jgi:hypothetical protein
VCVSDAEVVSDDVIVVLPVTVMELVAVELGELWPVVLSVVACVLEALDDLVDDSVDD